jgi:anti-sigma B factor antagonist
MRTLLRTEIQPEAGGVVVIRCVGELDPSVIDELVTAIEWSRRATLAALRIDTTGLAFIDSSGLRQFLEAHERCEASGVRLEFIAGRALRDMLAATGMGDHFHLVEAAPEPASVVVQTVSPNNG